MPFIPETCVHNAHMFYIKAENLAVRTKLIEAFKRVNILVVFHYVPLHSAKAGELYEEFVGEDKRTTTESERLLRLPMYYKLEPNDIERVVNLINNFYGIK